MRRVSAPGSPSHGAVLRWLSEHDDVMAALARDCVAAIEQGGQVIARALGAGRRLFLCGNGGSASDAAHIAAEFVGRFERERRPYPALALGATPPGLTALGNDYGFDEIFARELAAHAGPGDVLVAISTSGASANVLAAVAAARRAGCAVVGLTGARGTGLAERCDVAVVVPSSDVARVQEAHITVGHIWCALVDAALAGPPGS
jgi:D-sedoheptulose 7-phosphate isomerase